MQIVRTILWIALLALLLLFSYFNWKPVEVRIWENLLVETKVPALVIVSFLIGLVPMWIYHRGAKWSLSRKIVSLENAARANIAVREPAQDAEWHEFEPEKVSNTSTPALTKDESETK